VAPASRARPEVGQFCDWVLEQARVTRLAIGEPDVSSTATAVRTGQGARGA